MSLNKISVIIPSFHYADSLERVLFGIKNQTVQAFEIIIVDSSSDQEVLRVVNSSHFSNISIQYLKVDRAFPGEARNIGTNQAKGEYLAFLDSKTVPKDKWLESGLEALENEKKDVVFGVTEYKSKTSFQRILQAATFGKIGHETTPGSIIKKSIYSESNYFIEGVRTADDLFWRKNLRSKNLDCKTPTEVTLTYSELPDNYWEILKRYFI